MKDTKITKENYKQLFECAGFDWLDHGKTNAIKHLDLQNGYSSSLHLYIKESEGDFIIVPEASIGGVGRYLKSTNSTAEIDRLFYPFLDKPLDWEKKWDFESVFDRYSSEYKSNTKEAVKEEDFTHFNPRVQAFSRLLFVMNELNKEYTERENDAYSVGIIYPLFKPSIGIDSIGHDSVRLFKFLSRTAADLFNRDNEADLKTFFNIK